MNPNDPADMKAFAISLQYMTQTTQSVKNFKNIISDLVSSSGFIDKMQEVALSGDSSANLLKFDESSIIVFSGDDVSSATWKIIKEGIWDSWNDNYCVIHNLGEFVQTPSFQIALGEFFPRPFEVVVYDNRIEVKW